VGRLLGRHFAGRNGNDGLCHKRVLCKIACQGPTNRLKLARRVCRPHSKPLNVATSHQRAGLAKLVADHTESIFSALRSPASAIAN